MHAALQLLDDRPHRGEAEAGPPVGRLGGEERVEDPGDRRRVHADARVSHRDPEVGARQQVAGLVVAEDDGDRLHVESAAVGHRVGRVDHEVHHHLLHLPGVGLDEPGVRRPRDRDRDVRRDDATEHRLVVSDDVIDVDRPRRALLGSGEREQLPRQAHGALGGRPDLAKVMPARVLLLEVGQQEVRVAANDGEQVVEVVGDATGKPPNGFHPLRLAKAVLQQLSLGDVVEDDDRTGHVAHGGPHRLNAEGPLDGTAARRLARSRVVAT